MNAQEKNYASRRIGQISEEKQYEIGREEQIEQREAEKKVRKLHDSNKGVDKVAFANAIKIVKPEFDTMANIKKAVLENLAVDATNSAYNRCPYGRLMSYRPNGGGRNSISVLKNEKEVIEEIRNQCDILFKGQSQELQDALDKVTAKFKGRNDKLRVATQGAIDAIMLGESKEAVKAIADFAKLTF